MESNPIKLYFAPRTRATRARWILEELGLPYELVQVDLSKGEHKLISHLRLHPLGRVPVLQDGEVTIFESAAICMYLADKHIDKKLAPAFGTDARAIYYQWLIFAGTELEPHIAEFANHTQFLPEDKRNPEIAAKAKEKALEAIKVVEHGMLGKMYLVNDKFSAADIVLGSILRWADTLKLLTAAPDIQSWLYELKSRAAFKKAMA